MQPHIPHPNWLSLLLLPVAYFLSVKLCLAFAVTPEGKVMIWLPNAFTLAAMLYYRGQRYWLLMLLVIAAEVAGDVPMFRWYEAILLGLVNVAEVTLAYVLMRQCHMSAALDKLEDVIKFMVAGPLLASLLGALLGAAAIKWFGHDDSAYLSIVQV